MPEQRPGWRAGLLLLAALLSGAIARADAPAKPETAPILRVETGVHQAAINRMVLLADGATLATVSDDKTARLWSADGLTLLGTIMPPLGPGDDGVLTAVAATGRMIAIGGRIRYGDQFGVQFYRATDRKLIGHLSDLPAPVSALRFAPDGHTLAVGMVGGRGLGFFDMSNGRQVGADIAYAGQVQWLDTDAQGRTVATGEDGKIRLYGPDHRKIADATLPNGQKPYAVAFSPDGKVIAAGVQNAATVWLLDPVSLKRVRSLAGAPARIGGFSVVAFTSDGGALLGAGTYKAAADAPRLVRRWELATTNVSEMPAGSDTITDLLPLGAETIVSDAEPVLERLDAGGHPRAIQAARHLDFRNAGVSGFALSADGITIALPAASGQPPLAFDARQRTLAPPPGGLVRPTDHAGRTQVGQWRNAASPRLNGRPVPLDPDELSLAAAVTADGGAVALGTNFFVRLVHPDGTGWRTVVPSPAWAVNVSADGRLVVAGLGDGTVRWFDGGDGHERLEMFVDPATRHWAMSTPDGFFDHDIAAPGATASDADGRGLLGYRFNDPAAQLSRFVEIGQFYPVFYRPDLVGQALRDTPAARQTIQVAHEQQGPVQTVLDRGLPPTVKLLDLCGAPPSAGTRAPGGGCPATRGADQAGATDGAGPRLTTTADTLLVRFQLTSAEGDPGRARIFRDGAALAPAVATIERGPHSLTQEALIPLGSGANTIRLLPIAASGEVEGSPETAVQVTVARAVAAAPAPASSTAASPVSVPQATRPSGPTLYLLSVGISQYDQADIRLDNATNDARAVTALMQQPDPLYGTAVVTPLYDGAATGDAIITALRRIVEKAGPDDLVLIFFAGHGEQVDGHYYFAPVDFGTHNTALYTKALHSPTESAAALDELFRTEGVGYDRLLPLIQGFRATHVLMLLDTCFSGAIATQDAVFRQDVNTTVANAIGHATGRLVLSSATAQALDSSDGAGTATSDGKGHGLFTAFLLQALEGRADLGHTGRVNVVQLADYTISHVEQATADQPQKQSPKFFFAGSEFFAVRTDRP